MKNQKEIDQFVHDCFTGKVENVLTALDNGMHPNAESSNGKHLLLQPLMVRILK